MSNHVLNLYPITNAADLRIRYRLVDIEGSYGEDDLADQNLSLLAKRVAIEERRPAALVRSNGKPVLAVPADLRFRKTEVQLTPDVVELRPRNEEHELSLGRLTADTERLGLAFLSFYLRNPLFQNPDLWSSSPWTYFQKTPANYRESSREVDIYEGFSFRLVRFEGRLFVAISLTSKYSDSRWLLDRYGPAELPGLKMKHLLYHTGHRWFPVQLLSVTGASIENQKFVTDDKTTWTVYDYTLHAAGGQPPQWIQSLSPDTPAITFQYPGNDKKHHGAAALCKRLLSTDDPATRRAGRADHRAVLIRSRAQPSAPGPELLSRLQAAFGNGLQPGGRTGHRAQTLRGRRRGHHAHRRTYLPGDRLSVFLAALRGAQLPVLLGAPVG